MLYEIDRCPGTFVDACVRDEAGRLLLVSAFGRDTALKELMARIHLGSQHPDGLPELFLLPTADGGRRHRVFIGNPKDLDKLSGRLPKCVYGNLNHLWLYNPVILEPKKGADIAWVIEPIPKRSDGQRVVNATQLDATLVDKIKARTWAATRQLASIPLLEHWRDPVLEAMNSSMLLTMGQYGKEEVNAHLSVPIGNFVALKVVLDQTRFTKIVTDLVRTGVLTLNPPGDQQNASMERLGFVPIEPLASAN